MPAYCVEAAAQHVITDPHTLQGFGGSGRRGSRLGLQAWELISKSAEIRAEFRKTKCLYPPKVHKKGPIGLSSLSWRLRD